MDHSAQGLDYLRQVQEQIEREGLQWTAGYTPLLELSPEELSTFLGGYAMELDSGKSTEGTIAIDEPLPKQIDWRSMGGDCLNYITPIKDQRSCGSCVAFAIVAAAEGRLRTANRSPSALDDPEGIDNILPLLSERSAFSCYGCKCEGGAHFERIEEHVKIGIVPETELPYVDKNLSCYTALSNGTSQCGNVGQKTTCIIKCDNPKDHFTCLCEMRYKYPQPKEDPSEQEELRQWMKKALFLYGPLAFGHNARKSFIVYKDGIYQPLRDEPVLPSGHAMCLVGYDDDKKCFIVKNSWGEGWGEKGYARLRYDNDDVTGACRPHSFKRVYSKQGLLYDDIHMRDNFSDHGQPAVSGVIYQSPDIVPYGEMPMPNPTKMLEENWFSDIGKNVVADSPNYIYTRGNSLSVEDNQNFQVHLYYCKSSLLMYPDQWKDNVIHSASDKECVSGIVEGYGALAIPEEPFLWQPDSLPKNEHYCLIGRVVTKEHPNPIPQDIANIDDYVRFIATNPAYVSRNVTVVDSGIFDMSEILKYEQGNHPGETYFQIVPSDDAPIGAICYLSCEAHGMSFNTGGVIQPSKTAIGSRVTVPANACGSIVFGYKKEDFNAERDWSLVVQALYVPQEESDLVETCGHLFVEPAIVDKNDGISGGPRKGVIIGQYVIRGKINKTGNERGELNE